MKKNVKLISLLFVFLLVFENFAALGDNDGSAFITKAEFDSLKNNFQSQIDSYNTNIDSKIDAAIASYLVGISVNEEKQLKTPISVLKYPITIYNYENKYTLADFPTLTGNTKWWGPDLQLWLAYGWSSGNGYVSRRNSHFDVLKAKFVRGTKNKINDFFNIESYNTSKAKVSGMTKNLKCTNVITSLEHTKNRWYPDEKDYGYIFREDQSDRTEWDGVTSGTFGNIYANGAQLNKTNVVFNTLLIPYIIIKGALPTYIGTGDALYEKFTITENNNVYNKGPDKSVLQDWNKNVIDNSYDFVSEISQIYTGYKKDGKDELIPVSYNNIVYYENYQHYKQDLYSYFTNKETYSIKNNSNDSGERVPKISSYIDNGWTINPEGATQISSASTRPWYNRSLINLSHLYYDVKSPYSLVTYQQNMTDGILLAEIEKEADTINIELDITVQNTTNSKYLVVSKKPITTYDPNFTPNSDFYTIYDNEKATGTGNKKYVVSTGKKNYYLNAEKENIKSGDILYYKIIWGPDDNSYVKVNSTPIVKTLKSS